ncbi:MAG: hypothetical protein EPN70_19835 [Paraburkholderia sp.]|uniref:hypothetical protein n=1 Tax=Paraburkholderia sp. TaxID=1926495 RepID=UPI001221B97A|nr:hypothetical protein [Paraburkholderia sp.]TAM01365.1 MAG: hypothetical protein EPN70_19835 [Paraburkholderia sp.]
MLIMPAPESDGRDGQANRSMEMFDYRTTTSFGEHFWHYRSRNGGLSRRAYWQEAGKKRAGSGQETAEKWVGGGLDVCRR